MSLRRYTMDAFALCRTRGWQRLLQRAAGDALRSPAGWRRRSVRRQVQPSRAAYPPRRCAQACQRVSLLWASVCQKRHTLVILGSNGRWDVEPLTNHNTLTTIFAEPVHLQLVGSKYAGTHAVATLGGLVFNATEARAVLLFQPIFQPVSPR